MSVGVVSTTTTPRPAVDRAAVPWRRVSPVTLGVIVLVGIALPWGLVRLDIGDYLVTLLILFFMQAVVAQSWNLIMGYGGIYSFAQVALFAVGGWSLKQPRVAAIAALGVVVNFWGAIGFRGYTEFVRNW